jgi:hypothetical protein
MTGIDELRRTLDSHARGLHDDGIAGRAAAARTRAREARRRRNAAIVAAATVAVAAAMGLTVWPGNDEPAPADRELNGHQAPATMQSLGYTFGFDRGLEGADGRPARVRFDAGAEPHLLSWASGAGTPVRVVDPNGRVIAADATEFGDFVLVPPYVEGTFTVRGEDAALAVYELTDVAPGFTRDGITFRDRVAGDRLVVADIGERGQTDLTVDVEVPEGYLTASVLCTGGGEDAVVHLEFADEGGVSSGGCDDAAFDPGGQGGFGFPEGIGTPPGGTTTARVWVTARDGGDVSDDVRIGIGVYAAEEPAVRFAGGRGVPEVQEYDGHTWGFAGSLTSPPGTRELEQTVPAGSLVHFFAARLGAGTLHPLIDGEPTGESFAVGGGSGVIDGPAATERRYGLRVSGEINPQARLLLAEYQRID